MTGQFDEDFKMEIKLPCLTGWTGIEVKIMVGTNRFIRTCPQWLMAAFIATLMLVVLACGGGGGDEPSDAPASEPSNTAAEPEAAAEDTAVVGLDESVPLGDQVVPVSEPAAGSEEAAILEVFKKEIRAINLEDWDGFVTLCDPGLDIPWTPIQVKIAYVQNVALIAPAPTYNRRNATIQVNDDDTADVTSDTYSDDSLIVSDVVEKWIKVDGEWYFNEYFCHGGNTRQK